MTFASYCQIDYDTASTSLVITPTWQTTSAPSLTAPMRERKFLDFAHLRSRALRLVPRETTLRLRRKTAVIVARVHALTAQLTSWWDRTREAAAADVLHQPVTQTAVPPRDTRALRGAHSTRDGLRPVGLAARLGGEGRV